MGRGLAGALHGTAFRTHTKTPTVPASIHCKDCHIYKERIEIAMKMNMLFGSEGHWDYATCYASCKKRDDLDR